MVPFFLLFLACYIIAGVMFRLLETKFAGTSFGGALSYIHS
jgi:hypothetical protein